MKNLLSGRTAALVKKDFGEIWHEKSIRTPMILIPVLAAVILPFAFLFIALLSPQKETAVEFAAMQSLLPQKLSHYDVRQTVFYLALELVMPMLFLLLPLLTGAMCSSVFFAGERERGTMETILYTPMDAKKIGRVKWISSSVVAMLITLASFVILTLICAVGDIILNIRFFLDIPWLITVFLLAPLLTVMAVVVTANYSSRCPKQKEAYKISTVLALPVVVFYVLPFMGIYRISAGVLLILTLLFLLADIVLIRNCEKNFTVEKMLN